MMKTGSLRYGRAIVASLLALLGLGGPAASIAAARESTEPSRVQLVLDGSGSMWGQIDGRSKIEIAREVVGALLEKRDPEVELGLFAYGHRREKDCADIEALVAVAADNSGALLAAVSAIEPRGKTPIGAALEQAAASLDHRATPATVILISDGLETCDADPCAIAAALERSGVDFTAHVVGFDLNEAEAEQLACIATATGGTHALASNAGELEKAVKRVFAEAAVTRDAGVWLGAALAEGAALIDEPVDWEITPLSAQGSEAGEPARHTARTLFLRLPSGRYRVEIGYRGASGSALLDVDETALVKRVVGLGAGQVELSASEGRSQRTIVEGLHWNVRRVEADGGERAYGDGNTPTERLVLPAGLYRIRASYRDMKLERQVELAEGRTRPIHFDFGDGKLALRAVLADGGEPLREPVHWEVRPVDIDSGAVGEPIEILERATCLLSLASGRYEARARLGDATARLQVDLGAGSIQTETLNLAAGKTRVFATLPPPGGAINEPVEWAVYPLGSRDPRPLASLRSPGHSFVLPAGRYRISGRLGQRSGDGFVEVRAGEIESLGVVLDR